MSTERESLVQAIAALEGQRDALGDVVVDASVAALKRELAAIESTPSPESQEQRKQITVLFADVSGFTAMSETMDAEDVQETMNALWQQVDGAILEHNGRIDKHIGDAVMALWGTEEAREDDPEQAIRAALVMQSAVHTFANERQVPLKMRIGLNTGNVLLGEVGTTAEFTAMGDTVNTASRLEHAAPVGGILIGQDTYRHVRGIFNVEAREPLVVKGKSEPLLAYIVIGAKPRAFRLGTRGIEGIETKTIGRDSELQQLQSLYETAVRNHQTTVVTIAGEAGVGKSRLLYEFEKWLELRREQIRYFKGRASQQTQGIPHYLLRNMLADRFQILDSDPLAAVRQKFVVGLAEFLPQDSEMKAHILGTWLGYDFSESPHLRLIQDDPEQIKDRATLYLAQSFTAIGERQPIVVFLEDIHWADGGSLDTVVDLARRRPYLPLLVVCLARPSLYERRPQWEAGLPVHTRLELASLTEADTRALVAEILRRVDPLPERLLGLISSRAEGNPFYAEELVKMLIDDGVIVTGTERWQVVPEQLLKFNVPPTLTGVLQARLDKLAPEEKQALQQASVIGRVFWDKALATLRAEAYKALPVLQAKEFIFPQADSAFAGTEAYIFKHTLLRDVAYESVLKRLRRQYHALVADWLVGAAEDNGRSDEYAALIGVHYQLAEKYMLAALWYGRVGQQATATFAHKEAIHYLTLALQFTPNNDRITQFSLLEAREKAYDYQGNREAQRQDLERLAALSGYLNVIEQAAVSLRQAHYADVTSDYAQAIFHAQAVIELGQSESDMGLEAAGQAAWGSALWQQGHYSQAQSHFQTGLQLAKMVGDEKQVAYCLHGLGIVADLQGDYAAARIYYEQALAIRREIGDRHGEGASLNGLGIVVGIQGDHTAAKGYFEEALAISQEIGNRYREGACLNNLGFEASNQGDYATAKRYFEQSLAIWREIGDRYREGACLNNLGFIASSQEDHTSAKGYFKQSLAISQEIGNRWAEGISLHELGAIGLSQANLSSAESFYQQALAIRQELNQTHYLVEDWAGLAKVKLALGDQESAHQYGLEVVNYLKENNSHLDGSENPMRVFHFTWDVLVTLGQTREADEVFTLAVQIMQDYLDKNSDTVLQEMYLNQPYHRLLWQAWVGESKG